MTNPFTITDTQASEFLTTAIEGGIDYWAYARVQRDADSLVYLAEIIPHNPEDAEYAKGNMVVSIATFKKAWKTLAWGKLPMRKAQRLKRGADGIAVKDEAGRYVWEEYQKPVITEAYRKYLRAEIIDAGQCDCGDADNVLQFALFGEIIFG